MAICDPTKTDVGYRGWGESSEWREKVARLAPFAPFLLRQASLHRGVQRSARAAKQPAPPSPPSACCLALDAASALDGGLQPALSPLPRPRQPASGSLVARAAAHVQMSDMAAGERGEGRLAAAGASADRLPAGGTPRNGQRWAQLAGRAGRS